MSGAVLSGWVGPNLPDMFLRAAENHKSYARTHGYEYVFAHRIENDLLSPNGDLLLPHWMKVRMILESLDADFDWVFWIDMDSIFTDLDRSLEDVQQSPQPIVFTGDAWDVCNTGHLFVKKSDEALEFIKDWWAIRDIAFRGIHTTHIDDAGRLNDQPAFNYLLAGGEPDQGFADSFGKTTFDAINGYVGNPDRRHRYFPHTHAPTRAWRVRRATSLLSHRAQSICRIVPQFRLNGYPNRLPGSARRNTRAPIMHFPGGAKKLLPRRLESLGF